MTRRFFYLVIALAVVILLGVNNVFVIKNNSFYFIADVSGAVPLPQSFYDDLANPNLSVVNAPQGTFSVTYAKRIIIPRSNVTVNFAGSTLVVNSVDRSSIRVIQAVSAPDLSKSFGPIYATNPPSGSRTASHLTGVVTKSTTQLTMVPGEIVDVQPGEEVKLALGVNNSDPAEAQFQSVFATVASVNGSVITFTAPLGVDVTVYGTAEALRARTADYYEWKIGDWGVPNNGNYDKGYGDDHGMQRFVSRKILRNITLNNLNIEMSTPTKATVSGDSFVILAKDMVGFTINNATVHNLQGSFLHTWGADDVLVNGITITGAGLAIIYQVQTISAIVFSIWGGNNLTYRNVNISGTNIALISQEISTKNVWIDGVNYDVTFTSESEAPASTLFNFYNMVDRPRVTNASMKMGPLWGAHYAGYQSIDFDGYLNFPGSSLNNYFSWGFQVHHTLNGTVNVGGIQYGPAVTKTDTVTILHGAPLRLLTPPKGLYTAARFRLVNVGDLRGITDPNNYWNAASTGVWVNLNANTWYALAPGDAGLSSYLNRQIFFWMNNTKDAPDTVVEFEYTYLPQVGGTSTFTVTDYVAPSPAPTVTPPPSPTPSPSPICGNNVLESGEDCDLGSSNGSCPAPCTSSCKYSSCGVATLPSPFSTTNPLFPPSPPPTPTPVNQDNPSRSFDVYPPTTTANGNGYIFPFPQASWSLENLASKTSVTVTLVCNDSASTVSSSGCASTMYCIDTSDTCTPNQTYTAPVVISAQGFSYIRFYSTDKKGNKEVTSSETVIIRTPAPLPAVPNLPVTPISPPSPPAPALTTDQNPATASPNPNPTSALDIPKDFQFVKPLVFNQKAPDAYYLQIVLNSTQVTQVATVGPGSPSHETLRFGRLTKVAVIKFQEEHASEILTPLGLTRGTGIIGPNTRKVLNQTLTQLQSK